jgi:putative ABC transport system permease protein
MVLRGRFRQHWKSWLALSVLVAVAGGSVMAATAAARRTEATFPDFVARHGYDFVVYSLHALPQLASVPGVESVTPVLAAFSDKARCGSCSEPIDTSNFLVNEVPPKQLPGMIKLLSGRLPENSRPDEVLASRTLAAQNGVRVGSVIRVLMYRATAQGPVPDGLRALRVVGIAITEGEFPRGSPRTTTSLRRRRSPLRR